MLNKFINLIQRKWNQFQNQEILIYTSKHLIPSLGDESGLSVIRNNDYKYISKKNVIE